jgi:hypothetical protein
LIGAPFIVPSKVVVEQTLQPSLLVPSKLGWARDETT